MKLFVILTVIIFLLICFMWYLVYRKLMNPYFVGILTLYVGLLIYEFSSADLSTYVRGGSIFNYKSEVKVTYKNNIMKTFTYLSSVKDPQDVRILDCSFNLITSLEGVENFVNLEELICHNNLLTKLTGKDDIQILPASLKSLYCQQNFIVSMFGFDKNSQLEELNCSNNFITSLNGIQNCRNLKIIDCGVNLISSIRYLEAMPNLQQIIADSNHLQIVPKFLTNLQHLAHLDISNNPLETNDTLNGDDLNEFIESFNSKKSLKKVIYSDKQNTHDSFITKAIGSSISHIMTIPLVENSLNLV